MLTYFVGQSKIIDKSDNIDSFISKNYFQLLGGIIMSDSDILCKDKNEETAELSEKTQSVKENDENTESERFEIKGKNYKSTSLEHELREFEDDIISKMFVPHYKTGFKVFDKNLGGGISPGLTIIGGEPGLGKSTFAMQLAESIAASGVPVLYFTCEMPAKWIAAKAISRYTFVASKEPKSEASKTEEFLDEENYNKLSEDKKDLIEKAIDKVSENTRNNFYIIERTAPEFSAKNISEITNKFIEERCNCGENKSSKIPVVFVDYLQILSVDGEGRYLSDKQAVDTSINELTSLAHQSDNPVAVVLISSVSRRGYNKESDISALKESGGIEYSADVILGLQFSKIRAGKNGFDRYKELSANPRKMDIVFIKQRYGLNGGNVPFDYYSGYHYFQETSNNNKSARNENEDYDPEKPPEFKSK